MNKAFAQDNWFQKGLRRLLKDPRAKRIANSHWAPVRNSAVFHFDPSWFAAQLKTSTFDKCIFLRSEGKAKKSVYYTFADEVAFELMVGASVESEDFMSRVYEDTTTLAIEFSNHAESLIGHTLRDWGFEYSQIAPTTAREAEV